jgi:stage II sporulation protein P
MVYDGFEKTPPKFSIPRRNIWMLKKSEWVIGYIVHTHTTESYTPTPMFEYTPSDTDRTLDKKYNMVRVGDAVKKVLTEKGITVYHDTTINDYPSYNGSYNKSGTNIKNHLSAYPSTKIVLDIHRDAIGTSESTKTKYVCEVDGKNAACIMFVAGSDQSGLAHEKWRENLSFALLLQEHINGIYPDLCRPLNFRKQRFNQQLSPGAIIVEVGTNGNTLEEAIYGAELFARALADFLKTCRNP